MCLDTARLGKQRVEGRQIIAALQHENYGMGKRVPWENHPATKMWEGCIPALMLYTDCCIREWVRRGYNNTMGLFLSNPVNETPEYWRSIKMPSWMGDDEFHASHRSNLLRKNPEWYGQFGWTETPDLPYVWPKPH